MKVTIKRTKEGSRAKFICDGGMIACEDEKTFGKMCDHVERFHYQHSGMRITELAHRDGETSFEDPYVEADCNDIPF